VDINQLKLSAEKPISKQLADELTTIIECSTRHQRNKYWLVSEEQFKYQVDIDKDKFDNICKKKGKHWMQTLKYYQVTSTPTISRIHVSEVRQQLT
jgi:hypothetical protein